MNNTFIYKLHGGRELTAALCLIWILLIWVDPLWAKEGNNQQKDPLWWETLKWGVTAADQSTDPAPDLIPYDWLKKQFNELVVKPTQEGWDSAEPSSPSGLSNNVFRYSPRSNLIQRLGREQTMTAISNTRRNNYVYSMDELEALPDRGGPIGGSDVAPTGGRIKPVRAPRQSFIQVAAPIIKEQFDPGAAVGKIKILDTLQAIQHLIDCQEKGIDANECFKSYGVNFAMAKAISEVLKVVGQHAGWHLVRDAELGEAFLGGTATVGYLAYADYLAIQKIVEACQIQIDQYADELANQRQAENNEESDRFNWNGSLSDLQTRLDLFQQQFDRYMITAGDEIFVNWDEAESSLETVKVYRENMNKTLDDFPGPEELDAALQKVCNDDTVSPQLMRDLELANEGIEKKMDIAVRTLEEANVLAEKCSTEEEAASIRSKYEILRDIVGEMTKDLEEKNRLLQEIGKNRNEAVEKRKQDFIEDAKQAEKLLEEYVSFADKNFTAAAAVLRFEDAYEDYTQTRRIYLNRWKRFRFFLESRAEEILYSKDLDKAKAMLAATESYLNGFKPQRMPFESVEQYGRVVADCIEDLKYMEDVGVKLKEAIGTRVAELEKVANPCQEFEPGDDQRIASLREQIEKLSRLAEQCVPVVMPNVVGMLISDAVSKLRNVSLDAKPEEKKEACLEQNKCNKVMHQSEPEGKKVQRGAEVSLVYWGAFDKDAKCKNLQDEINGLVVDKNLQEANRLLAIMRSLGCEESTAVATAISRAEQIQRNEEKVFLPRVTGYPLQQARKIILDAGFKNDAIFDVKMIKTGDFTKDEKVSKQIPPGDTYQTKGAAVQLEYWNFDPGIAVMDHDCSSLEGSHAVWNDDLKKVECICSGATVMIRSKKKGARCAPCDEVKIYFDREIARGDIERAEKIRKLAEKICLWDGEAQFALNQLNQQGQAAELCDKQKKGSVAVRIDEGKYRCDCPAGTVDTKTRKYGAKCVPCDEMAGYFDKATAAGDIQKARRILEKSRNCTSWVERGSQILAGMQQQPAPAPAPSYHPPQPVPMPQPAPQGQPAQQDGPLTGTWAFENIDHNPLTNNPYMNLDLSFKGTLILRQTGQNLRGELRGPRATVPLDGRVNGNVVTLCFSSEEGRECHNATVDYQRLVMNGSFSKSESWSAVKQR